MSREDHRRYDALLEKVRQLERDIPKQKSSSLDPGWYLAAVIALALFLLAPRVGRDVTSAVLIFIFVLLVHLVWKLNFVQRTTSNSQKARRFGIVMLPTIILAASFSAYVWPPIKRHPLTVNERTRFEAVLKQQDGGDLEVQFACPPDDEKACTYAGQFIRPVGDSGWKVQAFVARLTLTKPLDGIMIYRRGGNRDYTFQHYDAGGYFNLNEPRLLAMQKAFQSIQIEPSGGADSDIPENVMMIYVGLERENEAEPTDLTKSTEWALGKRIGPFPGKRRTFLCSWFGLVCG
jgi:hypothetical protein